MITFLFVICGIFVGLLSGRIIEVVVHIHVLTVSAIVLVSTALLSLFSKIVTTGIKATVDFMLQSTKEFECIFLKIEPWRASIFTEICEGSGHSYGVYYLIHTKIDGKVHTFISTKYVELAEGASYIIKSGRSSNVYLESRFSND